MVTRYIKGYMPSIRASEKNLHSIGGKIRPVNEMGLHDVAGLVTNDPKTKGRIVNLLNFIGKKQYTLNQILETTGFNERYLRFLITKLRSIRLMMGENRNGKYYYYLSYESFTTYLKTKYSDAIYNLVKRG